MLRNAVSTIVEVVPLKPEWIRILWSGAETIQVHLYRYEQYHH
jgi:hypothetical protein